MRYTVTKQVIQVVGRMWMPGGIGATEYTLTPYDIENITDAKNRDSVAAWLDKHSGDFSKVIDFRADFTIGDESIIHEWNDDESELIYNDCMFPEED